MLPIVMLYATREGHTERIARHVSEILWKRGLAANTVDVAALPKDFALTNYSAAILAASVHRQDHEAEMTQFVKKYRKQLESFPSVFLSVSLSEAGAEDPHASQEKKSQAAADVERMIDRFLTDTGWRPLRTKAVAGALLYTKYNFLLRMLMKRIAQEAGGDTDTSRDYDYTDWKELDRFIEDIAIDLVGGSPRISHST